MKKERNIFMTKLWDSLKNKAKTIQELAKEFPAKTYRELEKYRDADRQEEARQIFTQPENEELKEDQLTESQRSQKDLEPIQEETWKDKYDLEHRLRQEAETETILIKGIGMNSPEMKAAKKKIEELKKENNKLYRRITELSTTDAQLKKVRESGL